MFQGTLKDAYIDFNGNAVVSFKTRDVQAIEQIRQNMSDTQLDIEVKKHREKRSGQANRMLWECIGRIANAEKKDKWDVYLEKLGKWGKFTYIDILPDALDAFKQQWRECQVVGEHTTNGKKYIEVLCFFGSSTYNTKEFSDLLDGVIHEMMADGLEVPTTQQIEELMKYYKPEVK